MAMSNVVAQWLETEQLGKYAPLLVEEHELNTMELMAALTDAEIGELLRPMGPRKLLKAAVQRLREQQARQAPHTDPADLVGAGSGLIPLRDLDEVRRFQFCRADDVAPYLAGIEFANKPELVRRALAKAAAAVPLLGHAGLDEHTAFALALYTGENHTEDGNYYAQLNRALRTRTGLAAVLPMLYLTEGALRALPPFKGTAYRAMALAADPAKYRAGTTVCWAQLGGLVASRDVAERFLGRGPESTLFEVDVCTGASAAPLSLEPQHAAGEVLLPVGAELLVLGVEARPGECPSLIVRLRQLPTPPLFAGAAAAEAAPQALPAVLEARAPPPTAAASPCAPAAAAAAAQHPAVPEPKGDTGDGPSPIARPQGPSVKADDGLAMTDAKCPLPVGPGWACSVVKKAEVDGDCALVLRPRAAAAAAAAEGGGDSLAAAAGAAASADECPARPLGPARACPDVSAEPEPEEDRVPRAKRQRVDPNDGRSAAERPPCLVDEDEAQEQRPVPAAARAVATVEELPPAGAERAQALVRCMRDQPDCASTQLGCALELRPCFGARARSPSPLFPVAEAAEAAVAALERFPAYRAVVAECAGLLGDLCDRGNKQARAAVAQGGAIAALAAALLDTAGSEAGGAAGSDDSKAAAAAVAAACSRALWLLSREPNASAAGEALVAALRRFPTSAAVCQACAEALANLARTDSRRLNLVVEAGAVEVLVAALRAFDGNALVCAACATALAQLAAISESGAAIAHTDGIQALVDTLRRFRGNAAVAAPCATALADCGDYVATIGRLDGIPAVLAALAASPDDATVCYACAKALESLARLDEHRVTIAGLGGAKALVLAMRRHPKSYYVCHPCAAALWELARNPVSAAAVVQEDGVPALVATLCGFHEYVSPDACQAAASALQLIAESQSHHAAIVQANGIAALVTTLYERSDSGAVCEACAQTLVLLADNPDFSAAVAKAGGVKAFVATLQAFPREPDMCNRCCGGLQVLGRHGGAQALVSLLRTFAATANAAVCEACALALQDLAAAETTQGSIANAGGPAALVAALGAFPGNAEVCQACAEALSHMTEHVDESELDGAVNAVVATLARFCHDERHEGVCTACASALKQLAVPKQNEARIARAGGIGALVAALRTFRDHPAVCEACASALANLTFANADNAALVQREGGAATLVAALRRFPANVDVCSPSAAVLWDLARHPQARHAFDPEGVAALVAGVSSGDAALCEACAGALACLAEGDAHRAMVVEAGGIGALVQALRRLTAPGPESALADLLDACRECATALHRLAGATATNRAAVRQAGGAGALAATRDWCLRPAAVTAVAGGAAAEVAGICARALSSTLGCAGPDLVDQLEEEDYYPGSPASPARSVATFALGLPGSLEDSDTDDGDHDGPLPATPAGAAASASSEQPHISSQLSFATLANTGTNSPARPLGPAWASPDVTAEPEVDQAPRAKRQRVDPNDGRSAAERPPCLVDENEAEAPALGPTQPPVPVVSAQPGHLTQADETTTMPCCHQ